MVKKSKRKIFKEVYALERWMPEAAVEDAIREFQKKFELEYKQFVEMKYIKIDFIGSVLYVKVVG